MSSAPAKLADLSQFAVRLPATGRIMGLDVGTKTIGIAVSDTTRLVATGIETLARKKFTTDAAHIAERVAEHQITGIVIGFPVNLDGSIGPRAQATRTFAQQLARSIDLPVMLWDERLTTIAAERSLLEADASRRRRAEVIDKVAATLILQGLLERLRSLDTAV